MTMIAMKRLAVHRTTQRSDRIDAKILSPASSRSIARDDVHRVSSIDDESRANPHEFAVFLFRCVALMRDANRRSQIACG
jgi:hypothetical protein